MVPCGPFRHGDSKPQSVGGLTVRRGQGEGGAIGRGACPRPFLSRVLAAASMAALELARGSTPCLYGELLEGVSTPDSEPLAGMGDFPGP